MELLKSGLVGTCGITIPGRLDRSSAAKVDYESFLLLILSTSLHEAPSGSRAPDSLGLQTCVESPQVLTHQAWQKFNIASSGVHGSVCTQNTSGSH